MLRLPFLTYKFFRFVNSGMYFDFFLKKISEVFVRNFLVYTALFFGEKFFIEVLTKKIIDGYIFKVNNKLSIRALSFDLFFYQVLAVVFYGFFVFNLIIFII